MDAQLSAGMASGATVFPSQRSEPHRTGELAAAGGSDDIASVDWGTAAVPRRTLPSWVLIALFVAALGAGLLLTFVIANLVR